MSATQLALSVDDDKTPKILINIGAKNVRPSSRTSMKSFAKSITNLQHQVPFYTPIQDPPAGTPWDAQPSGSLFSPLKLRGLTLHNRIIVSPMCQYAAPTIHLYLPLYPSPSH